MLEFGLRRGLSQRFDWNARNEDLRYQTNMKRQAEIMAANKAKLYSEQFDGINAMNDHDNPIVRDNLRLYINKAGKFVTENPDYQTNPTKLMQFNLLMKEMKSDPDLQRGAQSDSNIQMMDKYMSDPKNSAMSNSPEFQSILRQRQNYSKFGNQYANSAEDVVKLGGKKAFVFQPPEELEDVRGLGLEIGGKLGTVTEFIKGGAGAKRDYTPDKFIYDEAVNVFKGPKQHHWNQSWVKLSDSERSFYGDNKIKWAADLIKAGTKDKKDWGSQWNESSGGGSGATAGGYSAFNNEVNSLRPGEVTTSEAATTLSAINDGQLDVDNNPLRIATIDKDGNEQFILLDSYAGSSLAGHETKKIKMGPNGKALVEYKIKAPITDELKNKGLVLGNEYFWEGYDADEPNDSKENEAYAKNVKLLKKDGKPTGEVELTVWGEARVSKATVGAYDKLRTGTAMQNKVEGDAYRQMENKSFNSAKNAAFDSLKEGDPIVIEGKKFYKRNGKLSSK